MKIVAFMESPSETVFPEGTDPKLIEQYKNDQAYHRQKLRQSMSGNRLYQAFGDLFDEIHWDNVDPERKGKADLKHCNLVVKDHDDCIVILTFGNIAKEAIENTVAALRLRIMSCHHPNARFKTQSDLDQFAMNVRAYYNERLAKLRDDPEDDGPPQN